MEHDSKLILELLRSSQAGDAVIFSASGAGVRAMLKNDPALLKLTAALRTREISEATLKEVVAQLLRDFKPGQTLLRQGELCALLIALERAPSMLSEEILSRIAKLHIPELYIAGEVARACLQARQHHYASEWLRQLHAKPSSRERWSGHLCEPATPSLHVAVTPTPPSNDNKESHVEYNGEKASFNLTERALSLQVEAA